LFIVTCCYSCVEYLIHLLHLSDLILMLYILLLFVICWYIYFIVIHYNSLLCDILCFLLVHLHTIWPIHLLLINPVVFVGIVIDWYICWYLMILMMIGITDGLLTDYCHLLLLSHCVYLLLMIWPLVKSDDDDDVPTVIYIRIVDHLFWWYIDPNSSHLLLTWTHLNVVLGIDLFPIVVIDSMKYLIYLVSHWWWPIWYLINDSMTDH